jgi:hypothetical protein
MVPINEQRHIRRKRPKLAQHGQNSAAVLLKLSSFLPFSWTIVLFA